MAEAATIQIQLNGEPYQLTAETKVSGLIAELQLTQGRLAIELNLNILPRTQWDETQLQNGDKLEIVHFVGGG